LRKFKFCVRPLVKWYSADIQAGMHYATPSTHVTFKVY